MANLFTTILNMSLTASVIIGVVLLARLCLKKAPKIFSYVLWSVVLFRLLCPVSISLPVSVLAPMSDASTSARTSYAASMEYISLPERTDDSNTQAQQDVPVENIENNSTNESAVIVAPEADTSPVIVEQQKISAGEITLTVLGWLWAAGMVGVLGMTAWQTISLKRRLADACIIRGNIFESDKIDTAFILGVFNPKIYLPLGLPFDIQKAVVAHEQTHQRRGDHIVKLVSYIALAIHWFNPLVWLSFKLMCDDMEKSCDEAVIHTMYDRGYTIKSTKKAYGEMLLALGGGRKHIFSPVSFAENSTKERVLNIVDYSRVARNTGIALCSVCVLIAALCVVNPVSASASNYRTDASNSDEHASDARLIETECGTFWSDTTELDLYGMTDLSILKEFTNLQSLGLSWSETSDFSALEYCTELTALDISGDVADISFLEYCPNLVYFSLADSSVKDISPLRYCPELEKLQLWDNLCIDEYSVISTLRNLKELTIIGWDNFPSQKIVAECGFANLDRLEALYITNDGTISLSFLKDITNLTSLRVGIHTQDDIDIIGSLSGLKNLDFYAYYTDKDLLLDFSPLANLINLESVVAHADGDIFPDDVTVETNVFGDITTNLLQSLPYTSLRSLVIYGMYSISDDEKPQFSKFSNLESLQFTARDSVDAASPLTLDFLGNQQSLRELTVEGSVINLSGIEHLTLLENLSVSSYKIDGEMAIGNLYRLKDLELSIYYGGEGIDEVLFLAGLTNLQKLRISLRYDVSDLSVLSVLTKLERLEIIANLTDISCLAPLNNLRELCLTHCESQLMETYDEEDFLETSEIRNLDISSLSDKSKLEELSVINVFVDLSLLDSCSSLNNLTVYYEDIKNEMIVDISNELYDAQLEEFRAKHPNCITN